MRGGESRGCGTSEKAAARLHVEWLGHAATPADDGEALLAVELCSYADLTQESDLFVPLPSKGQKTEMQEPRKRSSYPACLTP
jgi:hypothetical protein